MSHSVSLLAGFLSIFCGFTYALISNFQKYRVRLSIPFVFSYKLVKRFLRPLSKLRYVISLPPCGGRHVNIVGNRTVRIGISIHSLRVEGDVGFSCIALIGIIFQSTPSVRRETPFLSIFPFSNLFQSTPSVRRETPFKRGF